MKSWKYAPPSLISFFGEALKKLPKEDQNKFSGWRLVVDTRPRGRRYGQCRYAQRELAVSGWLVDLNGAEHEQVKDTLLHEMSHVLTGPHHGHDCLWRSYAAQLGASTKAKVTRTEAAKVATPAGWASICPKCGQEGPKRVRRPRKTFFCSKCFDKNRRNGVPKYKAWEDCVLSYRRKE